VLKYLRFFSASLFLLLIIAGVAAGGHWMWSSLLLITFTAHAMERALGDDIVEPRYAYPALLDAALYLVFPLLLTLLGLYAWMVQSGGDWLGMGGAARDIFGIDLFKARQNSSTGDLVGAGIAIGYAIGLIATNVGHELTHCVQSVWAMTIGRWLLAMSCHASFSIEHVHGHHKNVATREDPATARRGESIYAFIARSIITQSVSAWRIERTRLNKRAYSAWSWRNRMPRGVAMSWIYFALFYWVAGWRGVAFFALASWVGRIVLEFSNYMQHYGLVRQPGTPVKAHHSWNSNTRSNSAFLFNLTRHTSHHQVLNLRYWECRALPESWMLPFGYLFGGCLMMIPPLWHRAMAPLLKQWEAQHASPRERALAAEANAASGSPDFSWSLSGVIENQNAAVASMHD
jgi:hypothetical protein